MYEYIIPHPTSPSPLIEALLFLLVPLILIRSCWLIIKGYFLLTEYLLLYSLNSEAFSSSHLPSFLTCILSFRSSSHFQECFLSSVREILYYFLPLILLIRIRKKMMLNSDHLLTDIHFAYFSVLCCNRQWKTPRMEMSPVLLTPNCNYKRIIYLIHVIQNVSKLL